MSPSMRRVVGIDLSLTRTGVATIDLDGEACRQPYVGVVETTGKRADSLRERDERLDRIAEAVIEHARPSGTVLAVIEAGAFSRLGGSNWDRAGLWWRVVAKLHSREIDVVGVAPTTLKKWATTSGRADKSDVAVAMARLWPEVDAPSNDAWDALALAHIGAQRLGWPVPARAHQAASVDRIDWAGVAAAEAAA